MEHSPNRIKEAALAAFLLTDDHVLGVIFEIWLDSQKSKGYYWGA